METFISILRGINVSGHRQIQMAGLKKLYEEMGFKKVTTFIQSGNVIFKIDGKVSGQSLGNIIEQAIYAKYHFEVPVIIRAPEEMGRIISTNPLLNESGINLEKLHITFLNENPKQANLESIKNFESPPDKFVIIEKEVFLHCPNGYGITKLSNTFFENKLKVNATTRNWKTVNKLLELARE